MTRDRNSRRAGVGRSAVGSLCVVAAAASVACAQPRPTATSSSPPPPPAQPQPALTIEPLPGAGAEAPIQLTVDATEAPRRIFHCTEMIPCGRSGGSMTLAYPKWIPGEHGPTGPIVNVAGLRITAAGKALAWRRDLLDMYAVHVDVPAGVESIEVSLDYLSPQLTEGFSASPASTATLAVIDWHLMLVYPTGKTADRIMVSPRLKAPKGWKQGGALQVARAGRNAADDTMLFEVVPLTMLVDTPVVIGEHFKQIDLTPVGGSGGGGAAAIPHVLDIVADSEHALGIPDSRVEQYRRLVAEETGMFGASHYPRYHFLLSLSDHLSSFGLEHHQCSDNRASEKFLTDDEAHRLGADLLCHEMFHSWNGKSVRPAGLIVPDYQHPMQTDLLWVYEGMTQYYGTVMAARAGFWTPEDYREMLAMTAANLEAMAGRSWRPLQDTADAAQILYDAPKEWASWRREVDFYDEGTLVWLEVDATIRQRTGGAKSLDDFCRGFEGIGAGSSGAVMLRPYTLEDVCASLNAVSPGDWRAFFEMRLRSTEPHAPMGRIAAAGWKLVYTDAPNPFVTGNEQNDGAVDLRTSLGLRLKGDGTIRDAAPGMPGYAMGLGPGMRVVAVNGHKFSPEVMREAVRSSASAEGGAIELVIDNADEFSTRRIDYHGGLRYPHLERLGDGTTDHLGAILSPRTGGGRAGAPAGRTTDAER